MKLWEGSAHVRVLSGPRAIREDQAVVLGRPQVKTLSLHDHHYLGPDGRPERHRVIRKAIAEVQQALRVKPDYPEAQVNLAGFLATIPGRVPEISRRVGYLGHGKEFREVRPRKSKPKPRISWFSIVWFSIVWFSIVGLVRLGRRLGKFLSTREVS